MNPENRFRTLGVLALAALLSYAVYGGVDATTDTPNAALEQSLGDHS